MSNYSQPQDSGSTVSPVNNDEGTATLQFTPPPIRPTLAKSPDLKSLEQLATASWPALREDTLFPHSRPFWVALIAALVPLIILGLGVIHPDLLIISTLILIIVVARGWGALLVAPSHGRVAVLMGTVGTVCLFAVRLVSDLSAVPLVLSFALVLSFFTEMTRGAFRPQGCWSLATMISGCILVAASSAWGLFGVYPIMFLLAVACLPACGAASLTLAIPTKHRSLRLFSALVAAALVSSILTAAYLKNFSDLALAVPWAVLNPTIGVWVMTLSVGLLSGATVACLDLFFPIRRGPGYHWQQLTLALLPSLLFAIPLYALSRLITG